MLVWVALVVAWRSSLSVTVFSLSEDDFSRTLQAWAVAHGTLFPTDVWPPGPAWAGGALIRLGLPMEIAVSTVNLAAVAGALALSGDIARRLGVSATARFAALVCAGMLRWPAWLALSGLAEPPSAFGMVLLAHGAVRLGAAGRYARAQVCAGAMIAALCRYEPWVLAPCAVLLLWPRAGDGGSRTLGRFIALLPLAVPLGWVALELHWGNQGFATVSRDTLARTHWRPEGWEYQLDLLGDVAEACGPMLLVGLVGGWRARDRPMVRRLSLLWSGTALAYLVAGALGFGGTHNPPRIWLGHALMLPVFVGLALESMALRVEYLAALVLGFGAECLPGWAEAPTGYDSATETMADRARQALHDAPGSAVVIEVVPWSCVALDALIGEPDRVIWDRDPTGEPLSLTHKSLLRGSVGDVAATLADRHAWLVVTGTPETTDAIGHLGAAIATSGPWTLWSVGAARTPETAEQGRIHAELQRSFQAR